MIEVGEYVRTDNGEIHRVIDIEKGSIKIKSQYKEWIGLCCIANHSKQLIDLVEVGDLVNGYRVTDKYLFAGEKPVLETEGNDMNCKCLCGEDIKTILTKEQYEANCYKVKEEIC